jgi:acetyl-CoA carboxylase biotin carboxyl carrier protein
MPQIDIVSPLPGTFYRQSSPNVPPFVIEGAPVRQGDVIGLVEVMKQFSEVNAEVDGVIVSFAVKNGESVEPGQTLAVIQTP